MIDIKIPQEVQLILKVLTAQGYQAYVAGGCAIHTGQEPQDWDIYSATSGSKKAFNNLPVLEPT